MASDLETSLSNLCAVLLERCKLAEGQLLSVEAKSTEAVAGLQARLEEADTKVHSFCVVLPEKAGELAEREYREAAVALAEARHDFKHGLFSPTKQDVMDAADARFRAARAARKPTENAGEHESPQDIEEAEASALDAHKRRHGAGCDCTKDESFIQGMRAANRATSRELQRANGRIEAHGAILREILSDCCAAVVRTEKYVEAQIDLPTIAEIEEALK